MMILTNILLTVGIALVQIAFAKVYVEENFNDDEWSSRWKSTQRTRKDVKLGKFERTTGEFFMNVNDTGIVITETHRFYGVSKEFAKFTNRNQTLVLQYSVKYSRSIALSNPNGCGGGYIQLFDCGLDPKDLLLESPFLIKFGPDICGYEARKEFFVTIRRKKSTYRINKDISWKVDVFTHVYTLIIEPNQNYQVLIDGTKVESGNLEDDWSFIEPKKIKDPNQWKPSDWDDQPTIADPNDLKPGDWDKSGNSTKWKPRQIENPKYMGPWIHPEVENYYYRPDPNIYIFPEICGVGFTFWQGNNGTIFDNVLITDKIRYAEKKRKPIVAGLKIERNMWLNSMTEKERQAFAKMEADEQEQADAKRKLEAERMARAKINLAQRKATLEKQAEEKKRKAKMPDSDKYQDELHEKLKLTICIATVLALSAIFIGIISTYFIYRYRTKYILSAEELNKFVKGEAPVNRFGNNMEGEGSGKAENMPYNKNKYEISPSSFNIVSTWFLGSCEFGTVCCGSITRGNVCEQVAVKMLNQSEMERSRGHHLALKGLISEIKILSFVGDYEHILKLKGAYTAKLRMGKVFVFLELCELGSLDKYLRQYKPASSQSPNVTDEPITGGKVIKEEHEKESKNILCQEMSTDLLKWSLEIASAMEFLASKHIVHADLATRNVLLNAQKCAKIADFGLSRRLYNYSQYQKTESEPLPWRWMAPEALLRMIFTEKTDVWAFGITLWEMFTLGAEPYPGLSWDVNFSSCLECGLRLPEPKYNLNDVYSVMHHCWRNEPSDRPTFSELKSILVQKVTVG